MKFSKLYFFIAVIFLLPILLLQNTGCAKEYSYEGGDTAAIVNPVIIVPDPMVVAPDTTNEFPTCMLCDSAEAPALGTWSFRRGKSYLCGGVTNSGFFGGSSKTDVTFFGPSACSKDTGLVMSVFLPVPLDRDRYNITAERVAFYYYDNNSPKDILISMPQKTFALTLQSFSLSTGIAIGTFSGIVFKANGDTALIANGKYKVLIK
ncbi:MAG: hypothetical protein ABIN25_14330 [Ginsengibacter sp.]